MGRNIVYRRVSTVHQDTDRQFYNSNMQFDMEFEDKLSGKDTNRPALQDCLTHLGKGDTLHVWEVSRLSRNLDDLRRTIFGLIERGVSVKFHKEGLEFCGDEETGLKFAMSKVQLNMMGSIAEFERAMIRERIKEGISIAKEKGVLFGGAHPKQKESKKKMYNALVTRDSEHKTYITNARSAGRTYEQIAKELSMQGVRSPRGSELTAMTVKRMADRIGVTI